MDVMEVISFRLESNEKANIKKEALKDGRDVSNYLRLIIKNRKGVKHGKTN